MGSWPLARAADLEPAAIDLDDRQGWPCRDGRLERAGLEAVHLLIPLGPQLLAEFAGDAVELLAADVHLGQFGDGLGCLAEGGLAGGGTDDLADYRGAVVMGRQP